jgi:predicted peroxiredoxin
MNTFDNRSKVLNSNRTHKQVVKKQTTIRKHVVVLLVLLLTAQVGFGQLFSACENVTAFNKNSTPDIGIVISSGEAETVWNALRLGIAAQSKGDSVVIFVISKAVDVFLKDTTKFEIQKTGQQFVSKGGDILTCATCAKMRHTDNVQMCTITSIFDLYEIIKRSKKVVSF